MRAGIQHRFKRPNIVCPDLYAIKLLIERTNEREKFHSIHIHKNAAFGRINIDLRWVCALIKSNRMMCTVYGIYAGQKNNFYFLVLRWALGAVCACRFDCCWSWKRTKKKTHTQNQQTLFSVWFVLCFAFMGNCCLLSSNRFYQFRIFWFFFCFLLYFGLIVNLCKMFNNTFHMTPLNLVNWAWNFDRCVPFVLIFADYTSSQQFTHFLCVFFSFSHSLISTLSPLI